MKGCLYVLFSLKDNKTYTGSTDNLDRRLYEHNSGLVFSTKNRLPLKLIYYENFKNLSEARKKEKYFKTCSGRKKLAIILDKIMPLW